jgi:lipopolysaccharide transport system ATP-binding protein
MSEAAINIRNVCRLFRRYKHPRYQVMETLGLRIPVNSYDEFSALRDINLEIKRGERLGLVGRNGAGKSTLLNIICGHLRPTSGTIVVRGRIQTLMELGTGFHPEFTARENVLTSLAYHGVTGRKARQQLDEIIDFAELQEFVDQPVKTFSSGMYARLAFTTSTAFQPDLLIIDEVLGAGDAYFAAKSAERMVRLTTETGATVLFVSHDLSAVQRLCNRAVWIDHGEIKMEGPTLDVSRHYYASIIEQQEEHLRMQTTLAIERLRAAGNKTPPDAEETRLSIRFSAKSNGPPIARHHVHRVSLVAPDGQSHDLVLGSARDDDTSAQAFVELRDGIWGDPTTVNGLVGRYIEGKGDERRYAEIVFQAPRSTAQFMDRVVVQHSAQPGDEIVVEVSDLQGYRTVGALAETCGIPVTEEFKVSEAAAAVPSASRSAAAAAEIGNGAVAASSTGKDGVVHEAASTSSPDVAAAGVAEEATVHASMDDEDDLGEAAASDLGKWGTDQGSFIAITPRDPATGKVRHVFRLHQDISFQFTVDIRVKIPMLWLVALLYDDKANRVAVLAHDFRDGFAIGRHELRLDLVQPNLRQGEYVLTFELLPELDYYWSGETRIPYVCHWDRCVHIKIDEDYRGAIDLGRVHLASSVSRGCRPGLENAARDILADAGTQ